MGDIRRIVIGHDNSWAGSAWHLQQVGLPGRLRRVEAVASPTSVPHKQVTGRRCIERRAAGLWVVEFVMCMCRVVLPYIYALP